MSLEGILPDLLKRKSASSSQNYIALENKDASQYHWARSKEEKNPEPLQLCTWLYANR